VTITMTNTTKVYAIDPRAKPRMTRKDVYNPKPIVLTYWAYKKHAQLIRIKVPEHGAHVVFKLRMPKSWSKKKKRAFEGQPHQQTPDIDNLTKGLLDAVFDDDSKVWDIRATKLWAYEGAIEITEGQNA